MVVVAWIAVLMGVGTGIAAGPTTNGVGTPISAPGGIYRQIGPTVLKAMLAQKDFTFVNVHIPYEGKSLRPTRTCPTTRSPSRSRDCRRSGTRRLSSIAGPDT